MDISLIWKSILIIIFGVLLIRFAGRRSISQMTISQTVIMISIGTLLIQPVSGKNIWVTFVIASILIATLLLIEFIQMKWDFTEKIFTGRSKVVIENGTLNEKNLSKLRLSVDKLEMRLRQNGIENIEDVHWATLEPSGQLGYSLTGKKKFATKEDIDKIHEMLSHLISQNDISISQLQSKNKSKESSSNLFSEIEGGHSPSQPDRLE
ncbi:DUF421 domain-containing protein [Peribacillus castrilensis]|uniref:Sporulation protein YdfR n=1 Tax=Peribacillus simplex TaxID=1478 RepID=A0AAN2TTN0_9BACI|nr:MULTISPECIES: DUF421 domain-containing protein [Bacillaceae]MCF7622033.1 DUF421 domain-containing protein [Peribacillus frigoritolerans]MCP1156077.1 DUF421 domain-containing protein [Peribacillus frigoritolerans]MCT1391256.1 DUF421 domain-containing protein [Peribacillus frigoritolerans]PRA79883.1 DUF421 domain-containing protein [Peribacillus simplex]CEG33191.1 sporulation protein YdfR [Peribacillus simplex]